MLTFLDVARMVDATVMMGVLGWGGKGVSSKVHPDLSGFLVSQFQWRRSIGVVSSATFLQELSRVFAQRGRNSR